MSELLPCPFCGCEAHGDAVRVGKSADSWWCASVQCPECECYRVKFDKTRDKAIEAATSAWNTRHERTCKIVRYDAGNGTTWLTCSECGNIMPEHDNYCSNCGAKVVRDE